MIIENNVPAKCAQSDTSAKDGSCAEIGQGQKTEPLSKQKKDTNLWKLKTWWQSSQLKQNLFACIWKVHFFSNYYCVLVTLSSTGQFGPTLIALGWRCDGRPRATYGGCFKNVVTHISSWQMHWWPLTPLMTPAWRIRDYCRGEDGGGAAILWQVNLWSVVSALAVYWEAAECFLTVSSHWFTAGSDGGVVGVDIGGRVGGG